MRGRVRGARLWDILAGLWKCAGAGRHGALLEQTRIRREHWRQNLRLTGWLLAAWFLTTFLVIWYARELNTFVVAGFPLGFYMGAQGALVIYLILVRVYATRMDAIDAACGLDDAER